MTALVAIAAIIVGDIQNSATQRIAARDSETRAAELRIDLLEERFSAWRALDGFVWAWYETAQADESVDLDGLLQLRDRVHVLFEESINEMAMRYCASVQNYSSARKGVPNTTFSIWAKRDIW